jgi:hypothetical protein
LALEEGGEVGLKLTNNKKGLPSWEPIKDDHPSLAIRREKKTCYCLQYEGIKFRTEHKEKKNQLVARSERL